MEGAAVGKQAKAEYICGNCEYDFTGLPAGSRSGDGRPLCERCVGMVVEEPQEEIVARPSTDTVKPQKAGGLLTIFYFLGTLIFLCIALVLFVLCRDRH
jgi:hypothetical protein